MQWITTSCARMVPSQSMTHPRILFSEMFVWNWSIIWKTVVINWLCDIAQNLFYFFDFAIAGPFPDEALLTRTDTQSYTDMRWLCPVFNRYQSSRTPTKLVLMLRSFHSLNFHEKTLLYSSKLCKLFRAELCVRKVVSLYCSNLIISFFYLICSLL